MNVCCIYSVEYYQTQGRPLYSQKDIPFGLSYIATVLKKADHTTSILVFTPKTNIDLYLRKYCHNKNPGLFCLTAVSTQYPLIVKIAQKIRKQFPYAFIILGGVHATLNPSEVIREECFDAICVGEGEHAIVVYARQIENNNNPSRINNLWIRARDTKKIEKNPQSPFIQNLDEMPFIDRTLWDEWIANHDRAPSILLGRGCPNTCSYCSNHALKKVSPGKYVRYRSPENVVEELECVLQKYPHVKTLYLENETFSVNLQYAARLCMRLNAFNSARERKVHFGVNISPNRNVLEHSETFFQNLKRAQFSFINIGLESGSRKIRDTILNRPTYSNEDIIFLCKKANEHSIAVNLFVLIGIPGESLEDYYETVHCARECNPQHIYHSICYPYPGTVLYEYVKQQGLIREGVLEVKKERQNALFDLPDFSRKQIQHEYNWFFMKVYKDVRPLPHIVALTARHWISMVPELESCFRLISNNSFFRRLYKKYAPYSV